MQLLFVSTFLFVVLFKLVNNENRFHSIKHETTNKHFIHKDSEIRHFVDHNLLFRNRELVVEILRQPSLRSLNNNNTDTVYTSQYDRRTLHPL